MDQLQFMVRSLQHPLEVAAVLAAREAWGRGVPLDVMVRSGLDHMGLLPGDVGALHAALFLGARMVGYARSLRSPGTPGHRTVDMLLLHPLHQHHMGLANAFKQMAPLLTPGSIPMPLSLPCSMPVQPDLMLQIGERQAKVNAVQPHVPLLVRQQVPRDRSGHTGG
jgi:hypothetical protein